MSSQVEKSEVPSKKTTVKKSKKAVAPETHHHHHPTYLDMVMGAFAHAKETHEVNFRSPYAGLTFQLIYKYILENYDVPTDQKGAKVVKNNLAKFLRKAIEDDVLVKVTGVGMTGKFRLGQQQEAKSPKPKRSATPKKTLASKVNKVSAGAGKKGVKKVASPTGKKRASQATVKKTTSKRPAASAKKMPPASKKVRHTEEE